jgi:hypothetical protein
MAYQERGSGPPHFDGKNYQMWSKRMAAFLRGKGQILWDVMVDIGYVQPMNFLAPRSRDMFDTNNKAVGVEGSSCWERPGSCSDICDLPERV